MASQRTAPGLITDQLISDFNVTATTIGLLSSIQFFVYTTLQIPMGIFVDRYGPNLFLISGAFLTGIGTIIYSLSKYELILFLGRILTGIGDATIWVSLVLILSQWFNKKDFSRLIGVAGMTGSLGFLLATVPFSAFVHSKGWRMSFLSVGILLCLIAILLYVVLVKKPSQRFFEKTELRNERTMDILRRIFSTRQAWALFMCHFGVVGGYIGFIGSWAVPYGMDMYGMSRLDASQLIMISLIGALIGAPMIGWLSGRLEKIKLPYIVFHIIIFMCWSTFLLFKGQPPYALLIILFFVIGFGFGSNSLTFSAVRLSFPIKESGLVSGFANTGGFLSAVLLPSIFGKVLDLSQSSTGEVVAGYFYGFITPVLFSLVGLVGVLLLRESWHNVHINKMNH